MFSSPTDNSNTTFSAYLYSIPDDKLTKLNVDQNLPLRFAWSGDSSHLVVQGGIERIVQNAFDDKVSVDLINVTTNTLEKSMDFTALTGLYDTGMCNLRWSPDMRYVAFISTCESSATSSPQEVYLWDTLTGKITQATSLATHMIDTMNPVDLETQYTFFWLSPSQLMIGMLVVNRGMNDVMTQIAQTVLYNPTTGKSSIFSAGKVQEISVNPVNGRLALSLAPSFKIDTGTTPLNEQVKIGDANANVATLGTTFPGGTNFFWSPDGKMLVYRQADSDTFVFVDDANQQKMSTFSDPAVAADSSAKTMYILPIGWVAN